MIPCEWSGSQLSFGILMDHQLQWRASNDKSFQKAYPRVAESNFWRTSLAIFIFYLKLLLILPNNTKVIFFNIEKAICIVWAQEVEQEATKSISNLLDLDTMVEITFSQWNDGWQKIKKHGGGYFGINICRNL